MEGEVDAFSIYLAIGAARAFEDDARQPRGNASPRRCNGSTINLALIAY